ncbi:MAG: dehypoxanthine futalosine cyclase [Spirochaetae bacterium HGW-Spirochaetae-1]|jgi:cyclic dehypoxanthinyl futalosine synthase|nr:MAG: dehypoxanthine futalosine cyclase [Spirochaetae bacterium HGW-Spirochaetae-1]
MVLYFKYKVYRVFYNTDSGKGRVSFFRKLAGNGFVDKNTIKLKIYTGERISREEAVTLFQWDIRELGHAADARLALIHPENTVGFILDRIVNFTNVCEAGCRFCAYHARAGKVEAYELSMEEMLGKIDDLVRAGGTQVMLQGGLHPDYTIETYLTMVKEVKAAFPQIYLHSFSPAEIYHISQKSDLTLDEVLQRLKSAGLDSVPGASDLLVDRIRTYVSPGKISRENWCEVMYALERAGMTSTATMTYGMGETLDEKIEHLDTVRTVQDKTGILRAFIPWSFSPRYTRMDEIMPATGVDYLKVVAIARIYLDNIRYIQAGWLTEGLKLAQVALAMGANDMGGILTEEVVVKATGIRTNTGMDELVEIIRNAGRIPVLRDSRYEIIRRMA